MGDAKNQIVADEWVSFPGGELEGKRPKELCLTCREQASRASGRSGYPGNPAKAGRLRTLCFQCYRAELDRHRAPAAERDATTVSRVQAALPFEPVNKPRLAMLKVERATARDAMRQGMGHFADKRRQAQIAARHALQVIVAGVNARRAPQAPQAARGAEVVHGGEAGQTPGSQRTQRTQPIQETQGTEETTPGADREHIIMNVIHAAELQLPDSWLPFVVSR
jgi:hypothetical protein